MKYASLATQQSRAINTPLRLRLLNPNPPDIPEKILLTTEHVSPGCHHHPGQALAQDT